MTLDLATLIASAAAVPTVTIPPGVYPTQHLPATRPPAVVRIVCAGVTFAGLQLSDCANLSFEGLSVLQPPVAQGVAAVLLQACVGVTFLNPTITGTVDPTTGLYMGKAVQVLGGSHVSILGGEISGFFKGVNPAATDDFTLSGCDIHHIRTSPVDGFGQRITISDNHIHDIIPHGVDHSDGIHIFTKGQTVPCDGLRITGNRLEMAVAPGTLGINLEGTQTAPFTNVNVAQNVLKWNNNQSFTTNWVSSGSVTDNQFLPAPGLDDQRHSSGMMFRNAGPALLVTGNTCKDNIYMAPYRQNTFLTPAQIAQFGAAAQ